MLNKSNTPNISNRPISIRAERIHLAASGKVDHEKTGPKVPKPGPTLPIADITVLNDSVRPTPKHINNVQPINMHIRYVKKKYIPLLLSVLELDYY